jgi:hypothetical protein
MKTAVKTRRAFLVLGANATGAAAIVAAAGPAKAQTAPATIGPAPMSKASVGYQDVPENGQVCAACVYFSFHPQTGGGPPASRCQLVAGPINPAGWCEVWQAKA